MKNFFEKISVVLLAFIMIVQATVNISLYDIKADTTVLTSPDISVAGFQIKTNQTAKEGIAFRTVCKAPDIGSFITSNGKQYTVKALGTIYTKDINTSGNSTNIVLNKSYTELNPVPFPEYAIKPGYNFKYVGEKEYLNKMVTFGYIATDAGITEKKDGFTSYMRTMTNMTPYVTNTLIIRAFVEAVDEDGNEVLIYGEKASAISIAEIAYKVYMSSKAPNQEGHNYIYKYILNTLPPQNPYYKEKEEEYGWGGLVPTE